MYIDNELKNGAILTLRADGPVREALLERMDGVAVISAGASFEKALQRLEHKLVFGLEGDSVDYWCDLSIRIMETSDRWKWKSLDYHVKTYQQWVRVIWTEHFQLQLRICSVEHRVEHRIHVGACGKTVQEALLREFPLAADEMDVNIYDISRLPVPPWPVRFRAWLRRWFS